MSLFMQARDRLKEAVGDVADDNADGIRNALMGGVQDVIKDQMDELLGKAVVAAMGAVREELQDFAALHLATKDDIARLERLIISAGAPVASVASVAPAARKPHPAAAPAARPVRDPLRAARPPAAADRRQPRTWQS